MRQALLEDRNTVLSFHRALYEQHRAALMEEKLGLLYAYRRFPQVLEEDVDAMLRNPATAILLAEEYEGDETRPIGYITGYIENDPRRVLSRKGVVGDWYVDESERGAGHGKRLLEALLSIFRESGCSISEIATWPFNTATRTFIESAGFDEVQIVYRQKL